MSSFTLTRSKHLDKHIGQELRTLSRELNTYWRINYDENHMDAKYLADLASMFTNHSETAALYNFYYDGDTAARETVPYYIRYHICTWHETDIKNR